MSKPQLHAAASQHSGVSYEASLRATQLEPSVYDRIGSERLLRLSTAFYDRVFAEADDWFRNIFASSTKQEAIDNQYRFLVQTLGGPPLYRDKKGPYTRLAGRHATYAIGHAAAETWVGHMQEAMAEVLEEEEDVRDALSDYFRFTAHYIVVAMEYMRPDQVRVNG